MDVVEQQKLEEEILAREDGVPVQEEVGGASGDTPSPGDCCPERPAPRESKPLSEIAACAMRVLHELHPLSLFDKVRVMKMVKDELVIEEAENSPFNRILTGNLGRLAGL